MKNYFFSRVLFFSTLLALAVLLPASWAEARLVEYNFDIDYKTVNFTGKEVRTIAVGGTIPGPTIEATVGDTLRVTFVNRLETETSIHWHGVLLPNEQDGVPYLNTRPMKAGESLTYEYDVTHAGTYWYHSHTGLQEQMGIYGSLVFHQRKGQKEGPQAHDHEDLEGTAHDHDLYDADHVIVLSEWNDDDPEKVLANLKKDGDYYALKKGSVKPWSEIIARGAVGSRLRSALALMGPMDLSDIGYDAFLVNGERVHRIEGFDSGDVVRLRIINSGASSYFNLTYGGGDMEIIATDGVDIRPLKAERIRIAVAETYDILVTIPEGDKAYELRAESIDGAGGASLILGKGEVVRAEMVQKADHVTHGHSMKGHSMEGQAMEDHVIEEGGHMEGDVHKMGHKVDKKMKVRPVVVDDYRHLEAIADTSFDPTRPLRVVNLSLTGDMERYIWSFDDRTISEADKIHIRKGKTVRFVMKNKTMMHHPLHLHGHFFRVLNGKGELSPLKHTVDVPPMGEVTIEFMANDEKDWIFHCHNLYHFKSGMGRVVHYEGTETNPAVTGVAAYGTPDLPDVKWYPRAHLAVLSNLIEGEARYSNNRHAVEIDFSRDYGDPGSYPYEYGAKYELFLSPFISPFFGYEAEREISNDGSMDEEKGLNAGLHLLLPLLIEAELRVDEENHGRVELSGEVMLTDKLGLGTFWNTDREYGGELEYEVNKRISLIAAYDYNPGGKGEGGIGIKISY